MDPFNFIQYLQSNCIMVQQWLNLAFQFLIFPLTVVDLLLQFSQHRVIPTLNLFSLIFLFLDSPFQLFDLRMEMLVLFLRSSEVVLGGLMAVCVGGVDVL